MRLWLVAAVLGLGACGNVKDDPPGDDDAGPDGQGFTLSVLDPTASVPLDGMNRIGIAVTRTGGFTGAVTLTGSGAPAGVSITTTTVAPEATAADVIIAGAAPLVIDGKVTFSIEGTGDGVAAKTVTLTDLPVTGRPGSVDVTFGEGAGLANVSYGADDGGDVNALLVTNGKILMTGTGQGGLGAVGFRTMRFDAAGAKDATWNTGALVRTQLGSGSGDDTEAAAIGLQSDGRCIVIGFNNNAGNTNVGLVRYSTTGGDGGADFGTTTGARSIIDLGGVDHVRTGVVLANSSIIAAGDKDGHILVSKLTATGSLDTGFAAPAGFERLIRGTTSRVDRVTTDAQNRILVAGTFTNGGQTDLIMLRYNNDGTHDAGFGTTGEVVIAGAANERTVQVRVVGGKIYLASMASESGSAFFRVRRFSANGQLDTVAGAADTAWGIDGVAELLVTTADARDMAVLADGRVVMYGTAGGSAFFARWTRTGTVDTLFGPDGTGTATVFIGDSGAPSVIEVYSTHQVVFGGTNLGGVPGPGTKAIVGRMWM